MPLQESLTTVTSGTVATGATITFSYPTGKNAGFYRGNYGQTLWVSGLQAMFYAPKDFTVAYGASNVTVTYNGTTTIPSGSKVSLGNDQNDAFHANAILNTTKREQFYEVVFVDFGAVAAASANAIALAQAVAGAGNLTLAGALASSGVATMDVPRNVVAVSANAGDTTQTATVYGTDEYGVSMSEALSLNGTTPAVGAKAFKTVTRIALSAATAGNITAGTGVKLGLPVYLPSAGLVLRELQDGAIPTAGTLVAGSTAKATTTTGDVRGTWTSNAAPDGTKQYQLVLCVPDPNAYGGTQA